MIRASMRPIGGLSEIAPSYDALLCDVWGVLHNGLQLHQEALDALGQFRAGGGVVVLISNAPRPAEAVLGYMKQLGLENAVWDSVVTSGSTALATLRAHRYGHRCFHIGPQRDDPLFTTLQLERVPPQEAQFILCSGLFDDETETPQSYDRLLKPLAARQIPFLCLNPDEVVRRGDQLLPCAGALATVYTQMGGAVVFFGKPHREIYDAAREEITKARGHPVESTRVLAIGDGLATDIAGGAAQGFDTLFILGGIAESHLQQNGQAKEIDAVRRYCTTHNVQPTALASKLRWGPEETS